MIDILIAKPGTPINNRCYPMPWKHTSTCFNFPIPKVLIHDNEINKINHKLDINSVAIESDLSDYSFISDMKKVKSLYICDAKQMKDLCFIEELVDLEMIIIENSSIASLDSIEKLLLNKEKKDDKSHFEYGMRGIYIASSENLQEQKTGFNRHGIWIGEFIIADSG